MLGEHGAIARAIAEGIGDARVLTTDEATPELVAAADLVVAGAPVLGFRLPTEGMRSSLPRTEARAPTPPDVSHPSMRSWLDSLVHGHGAAAAFETRASSSPGGSRKGIKNELAGIACALCAVALMGAG